jgi:uncharacterized protein
MPTFTWTATTPGGTTAWATPAAWVDTADSTNQIAAGFTTAPGADYLVNGANNFTIDNIGAGGTATPDVANSLIVSDPQAKLLFADPGGALDVATILSLSGLLSLGTVTGGSILSMGSSGAAGGTITLSASGRIEGAFGDSIQNLGTSPTEISGSGTILVPANDGIFNIGTGVQVASTGAVNMTFSIAPNATLSFADAVGGGTVVFSGSSSALDVGALSSFDPTGIKNLHVGVGANTETTVIDFINVGTSATAILSNESTIGATLNVFANGTSHTIPLIGNFTTVVGEPGKSVNVNYLSDGIGGTDIFLTDAACFRAGTLILTPNGDVPIEALAIGEAVLTHDDTAKPIKWIGRRSYNGRFIAGNRNALPIRIATNAIADGVPHHDLDVSPKHAMLIDGMLVPAELLVNGVSIWQLDQVDELEYFHIELEAHDAILAEGAPSETFVDCDNRGMFQNAEEFARLYPDDVRRPWRFCAERLTDGSPKLRTIRARLAERTGIKTQGDCADSKALARALVVQQVLRRYHDQAFNTLGSMQPVAARRP